MSVSVVLYGVVIGRSGQFKLDILLFTAAVISQTVGSCLEFMFTNSIVNKENCQFKIFKTRIYNHLRLQTEWISLRLRYTLVTYCDVKTWSKHTVRPHWTLAVLSVSLTQLNCGQLQCHVVVNRPIALHSECQWTI